MNKGLGKYPVSKNKLYAELKKRGLTPSQASTEIGFGKDYIANACCYGELSERGALYLTKFFRITPEDYAPDLLDMVETVKPETPEKTRGALPADAIEAAAETFARVFVDHYRQAAKEAIVEALKERGL